MANPEGDLGRKIPPCVLQRATEGLARQISKGIWVGKLRPAVYTANLQKDLDTFLFDFLFIKPRLVVLDLGESSFSDIERTALSRWVVVSI